MFLVNIDKKILKYEVAFVFLNVIGILILHKAAGPVVHMFLVCALVALTKAEVRVSINGIVRFVTVSRHISLYHHFYHTTLNRTLSN